jgi:hypothetical protein
MSLSPEVVAARITCRVAAMKVAAAKILARRSGDVCLPLPAPVRPRRSRPPSTPLGSGSDGRPSS